MDKFGNALESNDCEKGAKGLHVTLSSKQSLKQTRIRKEKENAEKISNDPWVTRFSGKRISAIIT